MPGGGFRTFAFFNPATQSYAPELYDQTLLTLVSTNPITYHLTKPDGSKLIFNQSDGTLGANRKVFLTQVLDPFGNAVTLNYDGNLRLTSIVDAIGQVTTLSYGLTNDTYKITKVEDPFGRFATFTYDASNRLAQITDVIGLNSTIRYTTNFDIIQALITPYGTNTFTQVDFGNIRVVETLYPDGSRDRVEFNQTVPIPNAESSEPHRLRDRLRGLYQGKNLPLVAHREYHCRLGRFGKLQGTAGRPGLV
jgi:YD repeat-containing protein